MIPSRLEAFCGTKTDLGCAGESTKSPSPKVLQHQFLIGSHDKPSAESSLLQNHDLILAEHRPQRGLLSPIPKCKTFSCRFTLSSEESLKWCNLEIGRRRLKAQHICDGKYSTPLETVESLGAVQAQDYKSALWAIGLRTKNPSFAMVERSFAEREDRALDALSKYPAHCFRGRYPMDAETDLCTFACLHRPYRPLQWPGPQ